jgi:hypothetical protein
MWISVNVYFIFYCAICYLQFFSFIQKLISSLVNPSKTHHICTCIIQFEDETCDVNEYRIHQAVCLKFIFQKSFFGCNTHNNTQRLQLIFHGCKKGEFKKKNMQRNHQRQQNAYIWRKCINFYIFVLALNATRIFFCALFLMKKYYTWTSTLFHLFCACERDELSREREEEYWRSNPIGTKYFYWKNILRLVYHREKNNYLIVYFFPLSLAYREMYTNLSTRGLNNIKEKNII